MMMNMKLKLVVALIITSIFAVVTTGSAAAPSFRWDFNEVSTAHPETFGSGITAVSGSDVINTGTSIQMPYVADWKSAVHRGRLTIASDARLNPGSANWAVTVRYRTSKPWGNLIQKGQNTVPGGYFKIELAEGRVTCLFKDGNAVQRAVRSVNAINDNQYHVIRCERLSNGINLYIDGKLSVHTRNTVGNIANNWDMTISGKGSCNQVKVSCDYFVGEIDYVQIDQV